MRRCGARIKLSAGIPATDAPLVSKQAIDVLLGDMSNNPQALETMIKSLQAVRDSQNAPKNP